MREMIISELTTAWHEIARGFARFLPRLDDGIRQQALLYHTTAAAVARRKRKKVGKMSGLTGKTAMDSNALGNYRRR